MFILNLCLCWEKTGLLFTYRSVVELTACIRLSCLFNSLRMCSEYSTEVWIPFRNNSFILKSPWQSSLLSKVSDSTLTTVLSLNCFNLIFQWNCITFQEVKCLLVRLRRNSRRVTTNWTKLKDYKKRTLQNPDRSTKPKYFFPFISTKLYTVGAFSKVRVVHLMRFIRCQ